MNDTHFAMNKLALSSLALSIVSLLVYVSIIARVPIALFAAATIGALVASIAALALGVRARAGNKLWATLSIVVALGYLLTMSIVLFDLIVAWVRR